MFLGILLPMTKSSGVTLVELVVVVAIAAILAAVAAPSFSHLVQGGAVSSSVNAFLADARYARSEAIRRGALVLMCPSSTAETSSPSCATGGNWKSGWLVFEDRNNDGLYTAGEPLIRQQGALPLSGNIQDGSGTTTKLRFVATGRARDLSSAATLTFNPATSTDTALQRVVCVSLSGRARIAGDGTTTCAVGQ
jgi:type IV fimbrial biogenesis protein FimT